MNARQLFPMNYGIVVFVSTLSTWVQAAPVPRPPGPSAATLDAVHLLIDKAIASEQFPGQRERDGITACLGNLYEEVGKAGQFPPLTPPAGLLKQGGSFEGAYQMRLASDVAVACDSADILMIRDSVVLASGRVTIKNARNCIIIAGDELRVDYATDCTIIGRGKVHVLNSRPDHRHKGHNPAGYGGGLVIAGTSLSISNAHWATCHVIRPPESGPCIEVTFGRRALFLNEPDQVKVRMDSESVTIPVKITRPD